MLIPTYIPRYFGGLDTWYFSNWTVKVYGIAIEAPNHRLALDPVLVEEARCYVEDNLTRMNATPHYSVGFVILHHGSEARWLLTQWWTDECICRQHVAKSELVGLPKFAPAKADLMACAYELVPIDFERRAWVSTVMSERPMADYLNEWLPNGYY